MTVTSNVNLQYTRLWRASRRHMKENLIILVLTAAYVRTSIQSRGRDSIQENHLFLTEKFVWFCFVYLFIYFCGKGGGGPWMQTEEELLCWLNTRVCIISVRINAWKAVKNLIFLGTEIVFQVKKSKRVEKTWKTLKFSQSSDIQWNLTETKTTHNTLTWRS